MKPVLKKKSIVQKYFSKAIVGNFARSPKKIIFEFNKIVIFNLYNTAIDHVQRNIIDCDENVQIRTTKRHLNKQRFCARNLFIFFIIQTESKHHLYNVDVLINTTLTNHSNNT